MSYAPEEILEDELPEGYHRMPDGTIMKDSAHEDEAALEKASDDPCWEGYVQLGTKMKNGKRVPNCVPKDAATDVGISRAKLFDILAVANEGQPDNRKLSYNSIVSAAYRAQEEASTVEELEMLVFSFAHTATFTTTKSPSAFVSKCLDLLPEGHTLTLCSLDDRLAWTVSDPLLDDPRKPIIAAAVSGSSVQNVHAWARLRALSSQGTLTSAFIQTVRSLELEASVG
jgi:hypothetical protein